MLIKDAQNLLEGKDRFFVSDVSHEPDGFMVLVRSPNDEDSYYGVNVIFDEKKNFKHFSTGDKVADAEAKQFKDEIIALAKKALGKSVTEGSISDFLDDVKDPFRKSNTGTPQSDDELIAYHQKELKKLGPDSFKSHREYHEKWIRKLQKRSKGSKVIPAPPPPVSPKESKCYLENCII